MKTSKVTIEIPDLLLLSVRPVINHVRGWWLRRAESHFLMCADVEKQASRQAQLNVMYYQKRAALARAEINQLDRNKQ